MEIYPYILKSTALLSLFFLIYEFLLKRDTFFTLNRVFLISGILVSASLPFLSFTKTIVVEENIASVNALSETSLANYSLPSQIALAENTSFWASIDYMQIGVFLYLLGVTFFLIRFLISLIKLRRILKYRPETYLKNGIRYIETDRETNPFTFFKTVVYNPDLHAEDELEMILHHERTHARNWHSLDILLGQLILALHWFNPLVWLFSKRIDQNLEFIADYKTTADQFPKRSYQMSLLRTALPNHLSLPVNYFHSFTKIRIIMLNKDKSHYLNRFKVLLVLPLLMIFLMSFQIKTITEIQRNTSSHIEKDYISNNEIDMLNSIFKDHDKDAILSFNGKKMTVKEIDPSFYKIIELSFDEQGIAFIQAERSGEESLEISFKNMFEGVYLHVSENANVMVLTRNASNKNNVVSVFFNDIEQTSKDDKAKEESPKQSGNVSKNIIAKSKSRVVNIETRDDLKIERKRLKDSFENRNRDTKVQVRYEIKKESEKHRDELFAERRNHSDSLKEAMLKESLNGRGKLQQERKLEKENRSDVNKIVSIQVIKNVGYKHVVGTNGNDEISLLRFEIDKSTSEASLKAIATDFAAADIDFEHKVLKRNPTGEISKIKMTLNNGKGSQSKVDNQSSNGIGTYILGLNDDGSIYITSKK